MEYYLIIAIAFFAFAWSRAVLRFKDGKINTTELMLWTALWWGLTIVVARPETIAALSKIIGIQRPIDVFVYGSIIVLFYLAFKIIVKIDQIEQDISRIVRKEALEKPKKK